MSLSSTCECANIIVQQRDGAGQKRVAENFLMHGASRLSCTLLPSPHLVVVVSLFGLIARLLRAAGPTRFSLSLFLSLSWLHCLLLGQRRQNPDRPKAQPQSAHLLA